MLYQCALLLYEKGEWERNLPKDEYKNLQRALVSPEAWGTFLNQCCVSSPNQEYAFNNNTLATDGIEHNPQYHRIFNFRVRSLLCETALDLMAGLEESYDTYQLLEDNGASDDEPQFLFELPKSSMECTDSPIPLPETSYTQLSPDVKLKLGIVLQQLKNNPASIPFLEPVNPVEVPNYYHIITNPMDLCTITKKLNDGAYRSVREFQQDLNRVWQNCYTYNTDPESIYVRFASIMQEQQDFLLHSFLPEIQPYYQHNENLPPTQGQFYFKSALDVKPQRYSHEYPVFKPHV